MIFFGSDCLWIAGQFLCFLAVGLFAVAVLCYDALNRFGCLHASWVVCLTTADAVVCCCCSFWVDGSLFVVALLNSSAIYRVRRQHISSDKYTPKLHLNNTYS